MSATKSPTRKSPSTIRLDFSSPDRVMVVPESGDLFMLTAKKAVEACERALKSEAERERDVESIADRFERGLLRPLRAWCVHHQASVLKCLIPAPTPLLEIYVIGKSPRYDFALSRSLSEFELRVADAGWNAHTMLIPRPADDGAYRTHFAYDGALEVYADREPAPEQVREEPAVS